MIKVAISGQARTGKNTMAEMIIDGMDGKPEDKLSHLYKIVAVADPIKNMVMQMVPNSDRECLWGASELRSTVMPGSLKDLNDRPLTYRKALMDLGSLGRKYHRDIWLNALVQDAKNSEGLKAYIVSDCRYPNEIYYLKEHGFHMIRIKRPDGPIIDDPSETAQLEIPDSFFNEIVDNSGTLEELRAITKRIVSDLTKSA